MHTHLWSNGTVLRSATPAPLMTALWRSERRRATDASFQPRQRQEVDEGWATIAFLRLVSLCKEPVDCLRRRIIRFWGEGERIASSSLVPTATCISISEKERQRESEREKHIKGSSGDAQHSWLITVRVVDIIDNHCWNCRAAQWAPKGQSPQTSHLGLALFLYIQCH